MTTATHQYDKVVQVVAQQSQQETIPSHKGRDIIEDFSWYSIHTGK